MPTLFRTGLKRKYPLVVHFGKLEDEWLARKSYDLKISKSELVRRAVLPADYLADLSNLRRGQRRFELPKRTPSDKFPEHISDRGAGDA